MDTAYLTPSSPELSQASSISEKECVCVCVYKYTKETKRGGKERKRGLRTTGNGSGWSSS